MSDLINGFAIGATVTFTTAGRYPIEQSGKLVGMDNGFAQVEVDGKVKKTRPSTLRAG